MTKRENEDWDEYRERTFATIYRIFHNFNVKTIEETIVDAIHAEAWK